MQCVMSAVKPSAHHLCWYKWLVDVFSPIFQTCSIWFHWSICQWSTGYPWCWMDALGTWAQLLHGAPSLRWSAFLFSEGPGSSEEMAFWPLQTHFTSTNGLKTFFWSFCFLQKWDSMQCPLAWLFSLLLFSFGIAVWSLFDSGHTQLPL